MGVKILLIAPTVNNSVINSLTAKGADICISKPVFRDSLYRTLVELAGKNPESGNESKHIPQEKKEGSCHLNILIAEDNEINAHLISTILEQHGANTRIVVNGEMVLEKISREQFDLILMDIQMPVLDGVDATKAIRENCALYPCDIPVVAVTANVLAKEKQRFLDAGINDLIVKPITEKSVWETINKWVEHTCFMDEFFEDDIKRVVPPDLHEQVKKEVYEHTQKIITALEQNDIDTLFTHAHKLNGLAAYFNIPTIRKVVDKLETSIKLSKEPSILRLHVENLSSEVEKMNS
jgi:CheY-like chemotaxis protein